MRPNNDVILAMYNFGSSMPASTRWHRTEQKSFQHLKKSGSVCRSEVARQKLLLLVHLVDIKQLNDNLFATPSEEHMKSCEKRKRKALVTYFEPPRLVLADRSKRCERMDYQVQAPTIFLLSSSDGGGRRSIVHV